MQFHYDDGGRAVAGFRGTTRDCATRAIAIATGRPYREIYDALNRLAQSEKLGGKKKSLSNSRTGVYRDTCGRYLEPLGWNWVATMAIGQGCKVHMRSSELPAGRLIVHLSHHFAAVIDGELYDTFDSSRGGKRCVYGYFYRSVY